jgi:hypothetical protein
VKSAFWSIPTSSLPAAEAGQATHLIQRGTAKSGINSIVQAAKSKARGYRTTRNLIAVAYLLAGKLDLKPSYP